MKGCFVLFLVTYIPPVRLTVLILLMKNLVHGGYVFGNIFIASNTFYSKNMNQEVCASHRRLF